MTNKPTYEEMDRRIKELEKESAKHKQAMAALQASEEKWGSLTKYSPDHIMVLNTDYSIQYINYTVPDLMIEQVIGKSCLDFVPLDYHQVATECFERVKKTGKLDQYETLYITAEGEKQYFNVRITPLMGECGSIIGLISVSNNITERKRAEEELRKHRDHLEELIAHRTQELQRVNEELQIEISERKRDQEILKESERYLNEAQTIANLGHWKLDPETKEVSGSDELFRIFGLGRDKFTLDAFVEVVHPDDREYDLSHIQRGMEQGEPWDIEHRLFLKNGTLKYVHAKGEVITDETGKPVMLVGTIQDITERKHAEEELRESEQFLSQVISQNPFPIWIGDSKGTLIKCNKALLDLLQLEENQLIGQYNILNDPLVKHLHEDIRKIFDKGENFKFEVQWEAQPSLGVDSSVVIIAGVVFPIMNQKGEVANIVATYNDITALRKSEETFRAIVEHVPVMIDSFDENGNCIIWNKELEKQLGYTISEVNESNNALELVYPKEEAEKILENILRKDCKFRFFYPTSKNGEKKIQEWADFALPDGRGVSIGVDITDRKRTEEALNEHQELIHSIVETSQDWIWSINLQGVHTYCNPAIEIILGYRPDELVGKPSLDLMHDEDRKLIEQNLPKWIAKKSGWTNLMIRWQHKDGTWRYLEGNAVPILNAQGDLTGFRGVDRDITERKQAEKEKVKLEDQLRQAQKMEAIGTLAGGIAHDFNNILGIIVGNTELMMNDISEWNPTRYNLEEVRKASLRARDMVRQILSFSRQTELESKPIRIRPIIEESLKLIRSSIPTTIEIRKNLSTHSDTILGDPTQINQILMNLCTNAAHAMRKNGGIIEVSLKNMDLDEQDESRYQDLTPGKYLALSVRDTGHGIEPGIVERIFDPYFTTKEVGEGSGMGLSVVHGIVKNHNGAIHVYSEPGEGTTFNVYFPLIKSETVPESTALGQIPTGTERILFVDDEHSLADLGKRMLELLGYDVTMRTSSIEALEVFREQPDRFDLVITDMTMPNMTGRDLCRELLQIRLDLPIILCTGFSEMITEEKAKGMGIKAFLMKPFDMREIAEIIRRMFDQTEQ